MKKNFQEHDDEFDFILVLSSSRMKYNAQESNICYYCFENFANSRPNEALVKCFCLRYLSFVVQL